jgi:hypothetical protein
MTTIPSRPRFALLACLALIALLLAACAGGPASAAPAPATGAPPTPVPGASDGAPASAGPDDPVAGDPGSGGSDPGGGDPGEPEPTIVAPGAGLTGVHPVGASTLEAAVNGRDVAVKVAWWSGVEPCNVLAGVDVERDGETFTLTVREGSGAGPDTACIEIAQYKATIVDLGELEPGTYTITAFGDAAPMTVTVD